MSETSDNSPKKSKKWITSFIVISIFYSILFGICLHWLSKSKEYKRILFSRAWNDTWELMGGATTSTIVMAISIFLLTIIIIRWWRGHENMKDFAIETISGFLAVIMVGFFVFLTHYFIIDPEKIYTELAPKKQSVSVPKPVPMRPIPAAEVTPPIVENHPKDSASSEPTTVDFEKDFVPTNAGIIGKLGLVQEQKRINALREKTAADKALHEYWKNALPYYEQTLLTLRDILRQRGATNEDEVETHPAPVQFLHCLPTSISVDDIGKNLGEIKLTKNTDLDFTIQIRGNSDAQRFLVVSCSSGYVMVHPHPNDGQFCWGMKTTEIEYTEFECSLDDSKQKVADCLMALIDNQTAYIKTNNVSHKSVENKQ